MSGDGDRLLRELAARVLAQRPTRSPTRWAGPAMGRIAVGADRLRRPGRQRGDDRRPDAAVPHLLGARRIVHRGPGRRDDLSLRRGRFDRLRSRDRRSRPCISMRETYGRRLFCDLRIRRCVQPDPAAANPRPARPVDPASRMVRHRLPRDRPGTDPRHDRELSKRTCLERRMRRNPSIVRGLRAAGFAGGWLDSVKAAALRARAGHVPTLGEGRVAPSRCAGPRARSPRRRTWRGCARSGGDGGVTIRFWAMGREGEVVQELARDFESENPGIRVDVSSRSLGRPRTRSS